MGDELFVVGEDGKDGSGGECVGVLAVFIELVVFEVIEGGEVEFAAGGFEV